MSVALLAEFLALETAVNINADQNANDADDREQFNQVKAHVALIIPHLTIGIISLPGGPRRRLPELTGGWPRERSGSSGFIGVPTIITTPAENSYKLNEKL